MRACRSAQPRAERPRLAPLGSPIITGMPLGTASRERARLAPLGSHHEHRLHGFSRVRGAVPGRAAGSPSRAGGGDAARQAGRARARPLTAGGEEAGAGGGRAGAAAAVGEEAAVPRRAARARPGAGGGGGLRQDPARRGAGHAAARLPQRARLAPAQISRRGAHSVGHHPRRARDRRHPDADGRGHGHRRHALEEEAARRRAGDGRRAVRGAGQAGGRGADRGPGAAGSAHAARSRIRRRRPWRRC